MRMTHGRLPPMMCAVCLRPVELAEIRPGFYEVQHPAFAPGERPHAPLPVQLDPTVAVFVCDFCGDRYPTQEWHCDPFQVEEVGGRIYDDDGRWAACETCSAFITKGDVDGLVGFSVANMKLRHRLRGRELRLMEADSYRKMGEFMRTRLGPFPIDRSPAE
jgi:hypothetical protein